MMEPVIIVTIETEKLVTGAADWRGLHICDYMNTGKAAFWDLSGLENRILSNDESALLFSVSVAAKELGCAVEIIDFGQVGLLERRRLRKNGFIPLSIIIKGQTLIGPRTKDEIVTLFYDSCIEESPRI